MDLCSRREFSSSVLPDGKTNTCSDGRSVWVNRGLCLARFCPTSHEYIAVSSEDSVDGLSYSEVTLPHPQDTTLFYAWLEFLAGVKKRWGVEIDPEHKPLYI